MTSKEVVLALAAFLDSPEARSLEAPLRADQRRIAETVLEACYRDLGRKPRLLDGEGVEALLGELLPRRFRRRDPLAAHVPAVWDALLAHWAATEVMPQRFEAEQASPGGIAAFLAAVRGADHRPDPPDEPQVPLVHRARKLGRNDPCFCGSGRKFKKCHGRVEPS